MVMPSVMSFSIEAGEVSRREPYIRVWESREGLGILYGMVEVTAGPPKQVAAIVWEGIEEGLKDGRLTVTKYLQTALAHAHDHLRQYAGRGWRAGATLISIRPNEFYIGRAGPSLVCLFSGGRLVRPGAASEKVQGSGPALGEDKDLPVPHVDRQTVREGDIFLMGWTALGRLTSDAALHALMATGVENSIQSLYRLLKSEKESALLVAGFRNAS